MQDGIHVIAGTCTSTFDGSHVREHEQHGRVVIVVKPDNTVLVHDADGYQPVAWLTRAETVTIDGSRLFAKDGDQTLEVETHEEFGTAQYPVTRAGTPVASCSECDGQLVRTEDTVTCEMCGACYSIPTDATILAKTCECGLPIMRVERGQTFELCVDRSCCSLDERVKTAFDREWACPICGGDLRIIRRGGLIAGCENYPDCDVSFSIPSGQISGECDCGLPLFETATGQRCLDTRCEWNGS